MGGSLSLLPMRTILLLISLAVFGSANAQTNTYVADLGSEYHTLTITHAAYCPDCTNWQFSIYSQATEQLMVWNGGGRMSVVGTDFDAAAFATGYDLYDNKGKLFMHVNKLTSRILTYTDGKDTVTVKLYE